MTDLKLRVDPIPVCLWGFNLREFIPQSRWLKLRKELIAARGQRCETCGKEVEKSRSLHAHEDWAFNEDSSPPLVTLKGIVLSCWHCHMCEHWGQLQALISTRRISPDAKEEVIQHFCRVNGVEYDVFEPQKEAAFVDMRRRTQLQWDVDWGPYTNLVLDYFIELPQPGVYSKEELVAKSAGCFVPFKCRWPTDEAEEKAA